MVSANYIIQDYENKKCFQYQHIIIFYKVDDFKCVSKQWGNNILLEYKVKT